MSQGQLPRFDILFFGNFRVDIGIIRQGRKESRNDFQPEIRLLATVIVPLLYRPDFVVDIFNCSSTEFVPGMTISANAVPVRLDQLRELQVGLQPLPIQAFFPALNESQRAVFAAIVPELFEALFENVGRV